MYKVQKDKRIYNKSLKTESNIELSKIKKYNIIELKMLYNKPFTIVDRYAFLRYYFITLIYTTGFNFDFNCSLFKYVCINFI